MVSWAGGGRRGLVARVLVFQDNDGCHQPTRAELRDIRPLRWRKVLNFRQG